MGNNKTQNNILTRRIDIFILTDPTIISINHIQQARKKADNGFNDVIAELYDLEFRKQEILKKDRIKEAKEKALELQRLEEENRKKAEQEAERVREEQNKTVLEAERVERERQGASARENQNNQSNKTGERLRENSISNRSTEGAIGSSWAEVSPQQAAAYMASKTGVAQSTWERIIFAESTNNPTVTNSIGCFGYLQLHPVHGNVSGMSPQQYLDVAVSVYNSQGLSAWEVTTNGMVN